jgi:hypothetical protein
MIFSTTFVKEIAYQKTTERLPWSTTPRHLDNVISSTPASGPLGTSASARGSCKGADTAPGTCSSPRAPSLPEPLMIASDEVTTVLAVSKVIKVQQHNL